MTFKDHFSGHADRYEAFRPTYPDALFAYLASLAPAHDLAWDCATGNGQAARGLTPHFRAVVATDASAPQVARAHRHPRVTYLVAAAERTPLRDASVDLVTVASALHWLDLPRFYTEVRRVTKQDGLLAGWGYKLQAVSPEVDALVHRLDTDILGPFWLPEVRLVEEGYRTMPFPFEEIRAPSFRLTQWWSLDRLMGCMETWSASLRDREQTGQNPIDPIRKDLAAAWGDPDQQREIVWPLHMRVGRISGR